MGSDTGGVPCRPSQGKISPPDHSTGSPLWEPERRRVAQEVARLVESGFHCSEAVVFVVGEAVLDPLPADLVRAATGFGGGVGGTRFGLCGALIGSLMLIGAVHGRADSRAPDEPAYRLSAEYLETFRETFGATHCDALRRLGYGSKSLPCSHLVGRAAALLQGRLEAD